MNTLIEYLKYFCSIPSPSGYEERITCAIKDVLLAFKGWSITEDGLGNVFATKKGVLEKTIMLVAHCDEVGFVVKYIDESGLIHFAPIGGIDISILHGLHVVIDHDGQLIDGVIGKRPIHLSRNEKTNRSLDYSDLWVDVGLNEKKKTEAVVSVGDPISFGFHWSSLGNGLFTSKSLDNRTGVAVLVSVANLLQTLTTDYTIVLAFSVQEELGLRGAITAGYSINPEMCIAIDTTHATDYPGIDKRCNGDIRLGDGPSIPIGGNFNRSLQSGLRQIAIDNSIAFQLEAIPGNSGTDIAEIQLSRSGIKTGLISIPTRYLHTPIEVASIADIQSVIDIVTGFVSLSNNS